MTEKPLPTAEIIHTEAKAAVATTYAVGSTLVMGHREKYWNEAAIKAIKKYASLHTEQALREFAERVKAGNDLYPELAESHCGCTTTIDEKVVDSIMNQLMTEINGGEDGLSQIQKTYSKSDIYKVCWAIRKRIIEANGMDEYLLKSGNEFIHAIWYEINNLDTPNEQS